MKPFIIQVQELEQSIVEKINESQLPAFTKKTILHNLYTQLDNIDVETINKYNEEQMKSQKKESDK